MTTEKGPIRPSPWHEGERRLQAASGMAERMEQIGRRVIRDFMPEQHRAFYRQLRFLLIGSVDGSGRPWASLVDGPPGFIHSPDERLLEVDRPLAVGDPASEGVALGSAVGLLGIELSTRRRNRMNGRVRRVHAGGFSVAVEQAFGNCPQYIQRRELEPPDLRSLGDSSAPHLERLARLDTAARNSITSADTFFVASFADVDSDPARRSVDVSHRGGRPGFVRVEGDRLSIPDFAGNLHFNTLGNLVSNPRAGLLFIDFESGDLLQLTGRTEIVDGAREASAHPGAERIWRVEAEAVVRRRAALGLRFALREVSPSTLMTGVWDETRAST